MGLRAVGLGMVCMAASGCAHPIVARYVYQDGEYGVVAIPVNTYQDRIDFRAQAEALMTHHFPEGYEIVRAEEVNEGERLLDLGRKTEFATEPQISALSQLIKVGKLDRTTSYEEKDKLQVRECRIIYKKRSPYAKSGDGRFTAVASLTPPLYLDPNEIMRHQLTAQTIAKADPAGKKANDPETRKASTESIKVDAGPPAPVKPATF
jgi:hypothetical protein